MIEIAPEKKARALVSDVIVIDGPACFKASFSLLSAGKCKGVWSSALQMTNMSSMPMPIRSTYKESWKMSVLKPSIAHRPKPAYTEPKTVIKPLIVSVMRQWIGLNAPKNRMP